MLSALEPRARWLGFAATASFWLLCQQSLRHPATYTARIGLEFLPQRLSCVGLEIAMKLAVRALCNNRFRHVSDNETSSLVIFLHLLKVSPPRRPGWSQRRPCKGVRKRGTRPSPPCHHRQGTCIDNKIILATRTLRHQEQNKVIHMYRSIVLDLQV